MNARAGEGGVEPEGIVGAIGPAVAVEILTDCDLEGVRVDGSVALVEHPDVEPRIGGEGQLGAVGEVLEGATVEAARRTVAAPAGAEVEATLCGPIVQRPATAARGIAAEENPVRRVTVLEIVEDGAGSG